MKITFGVTTKNEGTYVQTLLNQLIPFCIETGDEIVVVDDYSTDEQTLDILNAHDTVNNIKLYSHALNNDFATHKNYLTSKCNGDYIIQIDADETLHDNLLESLHSLLELNSATDLFYVPRVNIVDGITEQDLTMYGWTITPKKWIAWPDYQSRIYRNSEVIRWEGRVHERIVGFETSAVLPKEEEWAIYHIKDIERQRKQNAYYATLQR
jgi:glycosyltransferase involved in cell wall biosynthesis